ncbi:MAG TPA: NAD(P)-dependent oxidoreductase, partial [Pirellulaceae bacterium]
GQIGQHVGQLARAFRMRVLAHTRTPPSRPGSVEFPTFVPLERLFQESDVISLHCPLTAETRHLVDARMLGLMRPRAWLVNTARGALVRESDLAHALREGRIGGAALDVLEEEPMSADNPLREAPNCLITPHIAWGTRAARQRLMDATVANVRAFLEGKPQNLIV